VFLIDEIDKMGNDFRGDPRARCSRCSTPSSTRASATTTSTCRSTSRRSVHLHREHDRHDPSPLLDRMDVIQLSGYTEDEKFGIARKYLIPKQLRAHGLTTRRVAIHDKALRLVIREYTREAGVRNLERQIAALLRKGRDADRARRRGEAQGRRGARARVARAAAVLARGAQAHLGARRRDRARVDARRRRDPLHRGGRVRRQGPAQAHRAALGGDAGVGADRLLVGPLARGLAATRPRLVRGARRAHPRSRRCGPEGRAVGGRRHGDRDRLARHRTTRSRTTSA
jgi:hypothetical protein